MLFVLNNNMHVYMSVSILSGSFQFTKLDPTSHLYFIRKTHNEQSVVYEYLIPTQSILFVFGNVVKLLLIQVIICIFKLGIPF